MREVREDGAEELTLQRIVRKPLKEGVEVLVDLEGEHV
jgi:hypothetical protein